MTLDEFNHVAKSVKPFTDFVYFHLMGEPLLHPLLGDFIEIASENGLRVCLTTNGSLLKDKTALLLSHINSIHKISISLQAQEANGNNLNLDSYLKDCIDFGKQVEGKTILVYRLWNDGGQNSNNPKILDALHKAFNSEWMKHPSGATIGNRVFLEHGEKFDWPNADEDNSKCTQDRYFCYGLKDQIGILSNGTVVPCCLDNNGTIALGNVFNEDLGEIIRSDRAQKICEEFKNGKAAEDLCKSCGYATRFQK